MKNWTQKEYEERVRKLWAGAKEEQEMWKELMGLEHKYILASILEWLLVIATVAMFIYLYLKVY